MSERCPVCVYKLTPWANNTEGSPRGWTCVNCGLQFFPRTLALARATRDREIAAAVAEAVKPLRERLDGEIAEIDGDERFHYGPALVQVNAPLALIQVDMKARMMLAKELRALLDPPAPEGGK